MIRRRYRRRVEQAIEAGIIPPYPGPEGAFNGVFGRRQRDFGAKPELSDTWLEPVASDEAKWADIQVGNGP